MEAPSADNAWMALAQLALPQDCDRGAKGGRGPNRTDETYKQRQDGKFRGARRGRPNHLFNGRNVRLNAKICQVSDKGTIGDLLGLVSVHLVEMNCVNLTTLLHRVARMAKKTQSISVVAEHTNFKLIRARIESELLEQTRQQLNIPPQSVVFNAPGAKTDSLPRCWATIAWCYATLQVCDVKAYECIAHLATAHLTGFKTFELANLLWGFAKVGLPAPRLFEEAAKHIPSMSMLFSPVSISTIVWAYVTLLSRPPAALLKRLASTFLERIEDAESQEIANMCWSLATAKMAKPHVFQMLGHAAVQKLRSFNVQELANTAWAFSRAGLRHNDFFTALRQLFAEREGSLAPKFHAQGLANLLWALAKQVALGVPCSMVFSVAVALLPVGRTIMKQLKPQEFSCVLWSVAKLEVKKGTVPEADSLFDAAAKMDVQRNLSPQGLTNVLYAFTEFMGTTPCTTYSNFLGLLAKVMLDRLQDFEAFGLIYIVESTNLLLVRNIPVPHIEALSTAAATEVARLAPGFTTTALVRLATDAGRSGIALDPGSAIILAIAQQALVLGLDTFQPHEVAILAQTCGLSPQTPVHDVHAALKNIAAKGTPMRVPVSKAPSGHFDTLGVPKVSDMSGAVSSPDEHAASTSGAVPPANLGMVPVSLALPATSYAPSRLAAATVESIDQADLFARNDMPNAAPIEQADGEGQCHDDKVDNFPEHADTQEKSRTESAEYEDWYEEHNQSSPPRTDSFSANRVMTAEFLGGSWVDPRFGEEAGESSSAEEGDCPPQNRIMTAEFLGGSWVDPGLAEARACRATPPTFPTHVFDHTFGSALGSGTAPEDVLAPGFYMPGARMQNIYGQSCGGFPQAVHGHDTFGSVSGHAGYGQGPFHQDTSLIGTSTNIPSSSFGGQWATYERDSSCGAMALDQDAKYMTHDASSRAHRINDIDNLRSDLGLGDGNSYGQGTLDYCASEQAPKSWASECEPGDGTTCPEDIYDASSDPPDYESGLGHGGSSSGIGFAVSNFADGALNQTVNKLEASSGEPSQGAFRNRTSKQVANHLGASRYGLGHGSHGLGRSGIGHRPALQAEVSIHEHWAFGDDGLSGGPVSLMEASKEAVASVDSMLLPAAGSIEAREAVKVNVGEHQVPMATGKLSAGISRKGGKGTQSHDVDPSYRHTCACETAFAAQDLYCRRCGGKRPTEFSCLCACGTAFMKDALFCSQCGAKRPKEMSVTQSSPPMCRRCGATLMDNAAFCCHCGAKRSVEACGQEQNRLMGSCGTAFIPMRPGLDASAAPAGLASMITAKPQKRGRGRPLVGDVVPSASAGTPAQEVSIRRQQLRRLRFQQLRSIPQGSEGRFGEEVDDP